MRKGEERLIKFVSDTTRRFIEKNPDSLFTSRTEMDEKSLEIKIVARDAR